MHPDRKKLINPIEDTWENNLQKWFAAPYQGKEFQEGAPMILTENGERVRSKYREDSGRLFLLGRIFCYKYEKPIIFEGVVALFIPDFTILFFKNKGRDILGNE